MKKGRISTPEAQRSKILQNPSKILNSGILYSARVKKYFLVAPNLFFGNPFIQRAIMTSKNPNKTISLNRCYRKAKFSYKIV